MTFPEVTEIVLLVELIVLLVRVCDPEVVATVESIATVTAEEPSYEVPERPVPIVNAFGFAAVIVADPPREIADPLTVTDEFVKDVLAIFVRVFDVPDIVLLLNVCVPVSVTYPVREGISEVRAMVPVAAGSVKTPAAVDAATICVVPVVEPLILRPLAMYGVVIVGLVLKTTFPPEPT